MTIDIFQEKIGLEKKFIDLFKEILEKENIELYDLEYLASKKLLRVYIAHPSKAPILLEDCVRVDKLISPFFESESWIPEPLTLEVSSPGVFRSLKTWDHFKKAEGEKITVVLNSKTESSQLLAWPSKLRGKKKLSGLLEQTKDQFIVLKIQDELINISYDGLKKANIDPDFK